jgi:UDP-N-acetylmuramoyl-tripeptide--D-alanyl-D-alanine ligase
MPCRTVLAQLSTATNAIPTNLSHEILQRSVAGITTDTRNLSPGDVFVALRGDRFDGHGFVEGAIGQGAIAAIVQLGFKATADLPLLQVENTLTAYQAIARWWRSQFSIPVVAITGSVGKTTTKELIAAVLSLQGKVLKSQANYNNEIGVPKTLLELDSQHDFAVIEMGMRGLGEIELLTQITAPDIAVITNVGTAHIERLGSREAIAQAKCELLATMPSTGVAVLNHDNPLLLKTAETVWHGKTITYGFTGGDVWGQFQEDKVVVDGLEFLLPLPGEHNALNFLAALAVAKVVGIDWQHIASGVAVQLPQGRSQRYELSNDVVFLDETYNAGLESMLASLRLLAQTPGKRRFAVLGTMKELGSYSTEFHQQVGSRVQELGLDGLFILADPAEAAAMARGAAPLKSEQFATQAELVERLRGVIQPGDRLLFKASRAVGLDRVVDRLREAFMAESEV